MTAQQKPSAFDKEPENHSAKSEATKKSSSPWKNYSMKKLLLWGGIATVLLVAVGSGIYYFLEYKKSQELINNPKLSAEKEVQTLIKKIGKVLLLPEGEVPTVATVSDVNKLKSNAFFAQAKNGYKVLIYTKAKKAILYDPVEKKIIEVGPINVGENTATPSAEVTLKPVRVAIYNGTTITGLANAAESDLKEKAPNVTVISKGNAVKRDYVKTLVIDVTGANVAEAQNLAQILNGEVGNLPSGQSATSSAEIVVILGQ